MWIYALEVINKMMMMMMMIMMMMMMMIISPIAIEIILNRFVSRVNRRITLLLLLPHQNCFIEVVPYLVSS